WSSGGILRISLIRWSGGRSRICSALRSAYSRSSRRRARSSSVEPCFSRGHSCISTSLFALLFLFKALQLCFVNSAFGWIGGKRLLALRNRFDHLLGRKILDNIAGIHAERAQWRKARLESMVIDFVGMQLLVYPLIYAHGHHAIAVARARAKRQTVQRVHRALLLRHLGTRVFLVFPGESHLCAQR